MLDSLPDGIMEKIAGNLADQSWFFVGNSIYYINPKKVLLKVQ